MADQRAAIQAMAAMQAMQTMQALQAAQQQQAAAPSPPASAAAPRAPQPYNPERKRSLKFLKQHELKFALEPVTRDAVTGDVTLALCLFCKHFGREERSGRKRKATANLKFFKKSFRTDQYVQHHTSQHAALWARYDALGDEDRRAFFPATGGRAPPPTQAQQQLRTRAPNEIAASEPTLQERRCWFELPAPVLDLVLQLSSDETHVFVFSSPYDARRRRSPAENWTPAPGAFRSFELAATGAEDDSATATAFGAASASLADARAYSPPIYRVVVCSREELDAMVELMAGGLSFHQMAHTLRWLGRHAPVLQAPPEDTEPTEAPSSASTTSQKERASAKRQRSLPGDGPWRVSQVCSQDQTIEFVRLATAASLQMTSQLLHATWSVGIDLCAHVCVPKRPFVDVRVRFYCLGKVRSAHLLALPALERPFELQLFHTFERAMSAVLPSWRRRVVGLSTHGDAKVLARIQDTVTRIERQLPASARVYRVESASHEVHAVLTRFYSSLQGAGFVPMLRLLVTCIRRSPTLIEMMGSDPPSARERGATCANWSLEALAREFEWVSSKREQLVDHIHRQKAGVFERYGAASDPSWWLFLVVVSHVATRSLELLEKMGACTSCRDQAPLIMDFATELTLLFEAEDTAGGAASPSVANARRTSGDGNTSDKSKVFRSRSERFAIRTDAVRAFVLRDAPDVAQIVMDVAEAPMVDMAWENLSLCAANMIESLVDLSDSRRARAGGDSATSNSSSGASSTTGTSAPDTPPPSSQSVLPPVTPRALAALTGREFAALVKAHASQLREFFTDEELDVVDQEHQALRRASTRDPAVKDALEGSSASREDVDSAGTFAASWKALRGRFRLLQAFAGGLASARASDEPLFGVKQEASHCAMEFRPSGSDEASEFAADFALEGALHAQQFAALSKLVEAIGSQEAVI